MKQPVHCAHNYPQWDSWDGTHSFMDPFNIWSYFVV